MKGRFPAALSARWVVAAVAGCLLFLAQRHFRLVLVDGNSMRPGLHPGDLLVVARRAYRTREPGRGDLVLARSGKELLIKRVVGLPGEEVAVRQGQVYINGALSPEPYALKPGVLEIAQGRLSPGKFALLGDNRSLGSYQTVHLIVPRQEIAGKVIWSIHLIS